MAFTQAITYVFHDPDWIKKLLIPGAIMLIPVGGFFYALGWLCELVQTCKQHALLPKPFDIQYLASGFKLSLCIGFYYIPLLFIQICIELTQRIWAYFFSDGIEAFGLTISSFVFESFSFLYLLVSLFVVPKIILTFIPEEKIRAAIDFRTVIRSVLQNRQNNLYLGAVLIAALTFSCMGLSLMFIGVLFTLPFSLAFFAFFLGRQLIC